MSNSIGRLREKSLMLISHLKLKNWRNFTQVDIDLQKRQFIVGANASGKSNLLDAFRFLRDIAKSRGGGLQEAIEKRGGLSKIRCLSARKDPEITIGVSFSNSMSDTTPQWKYEIGIRQETRGSRQAFLSYEKVWGSNNKNILDRRAEQEKDKETLKQTHLEQVNNNRKFREIKEHLSGIRYMHLVPQLLRYSDEIQGQILEDDPFGQSFLENMAKTTTKSRQARLKQINKIIAIAVPRIKCIEFKRDEYSGRPHITAAYSHWRGNAALQREDQFSDGTLRLIALVWSLLENDSLLLLEEPELSLHAGIVECLAPLLYRAHKRKNRQVLISTHSAELLSDPGIGGEEVLLLTPTKEGTEVKVSSTMADIRSALIAGASIGEAAMAHTKSEDSAQLALQFA